MFYQNGYTACKELKLQKGGTVILYIHKIYTLENLVVDLTYSKGLEEIKVRYDASGFSIIESLNHDKFGGDLSELSQYRIFTNKHEAERSWLFLLNNLKKQFKKILQQQGFKSKKKNPELYL